MPEGLEEQLELDFSQHNLESRTHFRRRMHWGIVPLAIMYAAVLAIMPSRSRASDEASIAWNKAYHNTNTYEAVGYKIVMSKGGVETPRFVPESASTNGEYRATFTGLDNYVTYYFKVCSVVKQVSDGAYTNSPYAGPISIVLTEREDEELDSDNDGASDRLETEVLMTDPYDPDSDGDGMIDGSEHEAGFDPLSEDDLLTVNIKAIPNSRHIAIEFPTKTYRGYVVEKCDDMKKGNWEKVAEVRNEDKDKLRTMVQSITSTVASFYRVRALPQ